MTYTCLGHEYNNHNREYFRYDGDTYDIPDSPYSAECTHFDCYYGTFGWFITEVYKNGEYLGKLEWKDGDCLPCDDSFDDNGLCVIGYGGIWCTGDDDRYYMDFYTGLLTNDDVYVKLTGDDSNSGLSWDSAKKTIKAGLETVATNGTLHIAFGDYSSQDAITLDKTVDLLCENEGGGGTGTVVLPPTV